MVCGLFGLSVPETFACYTYRSSIISYDLVFDRNLATYVTRWSMKNGKLAMGCTREVLNSSRGGVHSSGQTLSFLDLLVLEWV